MSYLLKCLYIMNILYNINERYEAPEVSYLNKNRSFARYSFQYGVILEQGLAGE